MEETKWLSGLSRNDAKAVEEALLEWLALGGVIEGKVRFCTTFADIVFLAIRLKDLRDRSYRDINLYDCDFLVAIRSRNVVVFDKVFRPNKVTEIVLNQFGVVYQKRGKNGSLVPIRKSIRTLSREFYEKVRHRSEKSYG